MLRLSLLALMTVALVAPAAYAENAAAAVRSGNSLYRDGKYEEALKKYEAAQVESPADERVMFNLGNAQYKLGRHEEALSEHLRSAQARDTEMGAQSRYNAGNALYRNGRLEEAVDQYLRSLEIDPEDEDAKYNLEFVRREIRRRMNEQEQRQEQQQEQQEQQEQQKESQGKDPSGGQGSPEQQDQESDRQQETPQQKEKEPERQDDSKPDEQPAPGQGAQPDETHKRQATPPQKVSDENLQRWLDAVEAETAENMKEFLRKQQPAAGVVYPEDW